MHRRLGSATLSQLAFPWGRQPEIPMGKKSYRDNTVVKSKSKYEVIPGCGILPGGRVVESNPKDEALGFTRGNIISCAAAKMNRPYNCMYYQCRPK